MVQKFDFAILDWIRAHLACRFLDRIMPKITFLASDGILWILLAIVFLFFRKYRRCGVAMGVGMFSGVVIGNFLLKNLVRRDRPCWINRSVELLVKNPTDYSFPSGHTLASFIAATVIFHYDRKLGIAAYFVATLIAFSRLYLYVHFPTDVIAGVLLGVGLGIAARVLLDRFLFRKLDERKAKRQNEQTTNDQAA